MSGARTQAEISYPRWPWTREQIREHVFAERRAQGLPEHVEDSAALEYLARIVAGQGSCLPGGVIANERGER